LDTYLYILQLIVAAVLILVILFQTKGSGFSGAFGGDSGSIYRSRRGVEKTLFQFTIGLAIFFAVFSFIIAVVV
jgi:preprotein translocase subunit SecG